MPIYLTICSYLRTILKRIRKISTIYFGAYRPSWGASAKVLSFVVAIGFIFTPLFLILFKPIRFPFADDWLIVSWNSKHQEIFSTAAFSPINGHQVILSKALLKLIAEISPYNLQLIALSSYFFGFVGLILLIRSQINTDRSPLRFIFLTASIFICFSFKQMQNFFMPICNGWMVAIFWIGLYFYFKQKYQSNNAKFMIYVISFLAPLSIGLGIIIPLAEGVQKIYEYIVGQKNSRSLVRFLSSLFFYSIPISSIFVLSRLSIMESTSSSTPSAMKNALSVVSHPLESFYFIFSLVGNVFVPSSRLDKILPLVAGVTVIALFISIMRSKCDREFLDSIFLNQSSILCGSIFILILLLFRFETKSAGLAAAAPRYVTGSVVLIIGLLGAVQKSGETSKYLSILLIMATLSSGISGVKTGLEWHTVRYTQSQELMRCIQEENFNQESHCYKIAKESSITPSSEFFNYELSKFISGVNSGK